MKEREGGLKFYGWVNLLLQYTCIHTHTHTCACTCTSTCLDLTTNNFSTYMYTHINSYLKLAFHISVDLLWWCSLLRPPEGLDSAPPPPPPTLSNSDAALSSDCILLTRLLPPPPPEVCPPLPPTRGFFFAFLIEVLRGISFFALVLLLVGSGLVSVLWKYEKKQSYKLSILLMMYGNHEPLLYHSFQFFWIFTWWNLILH